MAGFFEIEESRTALISTTPKCGACGLYKGCKSPKMPVTGDGQRKILIVAEAPGETEDERGTQLVGEAGQYLRQALRDIGISLDRDCWKTNALICRPPENRTPTNAEIDYCRPNLWNTINQLKPDIIVPLGAVAVRSLLGPIWKEDVGAMGQWAGWKIPLQTLNAWVCPNYHPSYVLRAAENPEGPAVKVWFHRILAQLRDLSGKPWGKVPDYASEIRVEMNPTAAAEWIREKIQDGGLVAFDFETDRLKPDDSSAEIVCCSVCWRGRETIAYPWTGEAITATDELTLSDVPKIGANNKFEDRWTRRMFGHGVNNFVWDTVIAAHHLDNRDGITSVKFQAFVRLGLPPWNENIRPYLEADGGNDKNRIWQCDPRALLVYCGIDSLCEYKIARLQRMELQNAGGNIRGV